MVEKNDEENSLEKLKEIQGKLDYFIWEQSGKEFEIKSYKNMIRLSTSLLVEIGELANEIKTFKVWKKKKEINYEKAKEELMDVLCFFLGLSNLNEIKLKEKNFKTFPKFSYLAKNDDNYFIFNKLLNDLFFYASKLRIDETNFNKYLVKQEYNQIYKKKINILFSNNYYNFLNNFNFVAKKLDMGENEIIKMYLKKIENNYYRAKEGQ